MNRDQIIFGMILLLIITAVMWLQLTVFAVILLIALAGGIAISNKPVLGYYGLILATWLDSINPFIFAGGLTLNRALVAVTLFAIISRVVLKRDKFRLKFTLFDLLFFFFCIVVCFSIVVNGNGVRTISQVSSLVIGYFYYWLAINVITTRQQVVILAGIIVLANIPIAISTVQAALTATSGIRFSGIQSLGDTGSQSAIAVIFALLIARWSSWRISSIFVRISILGLMLLFVLTILLSGSRTALISLLVMITIIFALSTLKQRLANLVVMVFCLLLAYQATGLIAPETYERLAVVEVAAMSDLNTAIEQEQSFASRLQVYERSWRAFNTSPIVGIGFGNLHNWDGFSRSSHSVFLSTLGETGIIGFLSLLMMYGYCIFVALQALRRNENKQDQFFVIVMLATFVGYNIIIASFALSELRRLMFMHFALLVLLRPGGLIAASSDQLSVEAREQ